MWIKEFLIRVRRLFIDLPAWLIIIAIMLSIGVFNITIYITLYFPAWLIAGEDGPTWVLYKLQWWDRWLTPILKGEELGKERQNAE
jgi:hypothetical protein